MAIDTLLIATHNQGKVKEFEELLNGLGIALKSANDFNLPEPEETEETFVGNALLKARAAVAATGLPCLADDSGLTVSALDGAPGVYSARWAETENGRDFNLAMQKVQDNISKMNGSGIDGSQSASFVAVLALVFPDDNANVKHEIFEGWADGHLCWPPRGDKGFGYDPIFMPDGYDVTFAEMEPEQKQSMSHRAHAVAKFKNYLIKNV